MRSLEKRNLPRAALPSLGGLLVLGLLCAGSMQADTNGPSTTVDRLRAFAKVYGYTRFFHPSDEAAGADWDKLAVEGAARIKGMTKKDRLDRVLLEIFRPVAPSIQIVAVDSGDPKPPVAAPPPPGGDVLAWQHRGVGVLNNEYYASVRSNRDNFYGANINTLTSLTQTIPAWDLRGKEIRLRFAARMETPRSVGFPMGWGGGTLIESLEDGDIGFYKRMEDRKITDPEWHQYEIVGVVDENAAVIYLGAYFYYAGSLWLDAFECEVRDPGGIWEPVELANPGFEEGPPPLTGWEHYVGEFRFTVDTTWPFEGEASALIANNVTPAPDQLFKEMPALGETIDKEIGCGLRVILPLALSAEVVEEGATSEPTEDGDFETDATAERIASVVIAWNVFQHFYPYFDVLDTDWDEELMEALTGAIEAQSDPEFFRTMEKLTAALQDGHISLAGSDLDYNNARLPFRTRWIENQAVVIGTATPEILPGDVVVQVDGRPVEEILLEAEQYISGSPQRKRYISTEWMLVYGENHSEAVVTFRRDGEEYQLNLERTTVPVPAIPRPDPITEIAEDIYYVDLSRAPISEINQVVDQLASAAGVIFDLRGYPLTAAETVIAYMIDEQVQSAIWNRPLTIYPDREFLGWDTSGRWTISPREPRIQGKIVFMTDVRAISYAESVMGIIEAYELAEIVGRPTSGANGSVNLLHLPGGFATAWTAMKVLKHDGSQHHLIGILPTVPVALTIQGAREGRDEDLEAAIGIIQAEALP